MKDKNTESSSSERIVYLTKWWEGLWTQIRQKEDAVWRFITFYAAAIVLSAGLIDFSNITESASISSIQIFVISAILWATSGWGIAIVQDSNHVLQRNLMLIGNFEREILNPEDLGIILPRYYAEKTRYSYDKSYAIHMHVFFTAILLTLLLLAYYLTIIGSPGDSSLDFGIGLLSILFGSILFYNYRIMTQYTFTYWQDRQLAPGIKPGSQNAQPIGNREKEGMVFFSMLLPPVINWIWLILSFGAGLFMFAAYKTQVYVPDFLTIDILLTLALPLIGMLGFVFFLLLNRKLHYLLLKKEDISELKFLRLKIKTSKITRFVSWYVFLLCAIPGIVWLWLMSIQFIQLFNM